MATLFKKIINKFERLIINPLLAKKRRKKLKTTSFTIISNNCWGGACYEYFNLQKKSPTVGAYFYASDYVKLCKNLKHYLLDTELVIIETNKSSHFSELQHEKHENSIVGLLDDVEIVFLHYSDKKTIIEKWKRRIKRIDWKHIILKFSYQNSCTDDDIAEFLNISEYKKFCFVGEHITDSDNEILFKTHNGKMTIEETTCFGSGMDVIKILNDRLSV